MKRILAVLVALVAALMVLGGCYVRAHTAPPPRAVVVARPQPARTVVVAQPARPQPVYVAPVAQPAGPPPPTVVY
ncbi:MAG: hypothetical protein JXB32_08800 [Deltaproteobacteria bacterium]|nr:hypothetical protein [Deltaproteobacteria bacterium]